MMYFLSLKNILLLDLLHNKYYYNNIRRKACFSSGLTLKSEYLPSVCIGGWQATQKPEMLAGRVCQWLADNTKISHVLQRELIILRWYNSLFCFWRFL